jgi:SEC-C motif-containing protein
MSKCPCSSDLDYEQCCGPYLAGEGSPPTAEALLRSRYTAFTVDDMKYVRRTTHPRSPEEFDEEAAHNWSVSSYWVGLEIIDAEGGGPDDDDARIEFAATYIQDEEEKVHHEHSHFKRENGRWYFVDGKYAGGQTYVRPEPKVGRNDPCPCGSGKKFKKCCGR